jgi:tetratricopeptide (TPR) repeat protein
MRKSNKKIALSMIFPVLMGWMTACTGSAEAFLEKAKGELQKGKAKEAIEYLNQAIDKDAQSAAAFNMRGAAYFELKDYTNALLDYEQAIKLDASNYKPFLTVPLLKWSNPTGKVLMKIVLRQ